MLRIRRVAAVAVAAGTALATFTGVASASASPNHQLQVVKTLPGDFVGPLQFAVSGHTVAVADSFTSSLFLVGRSKPIATGFPPTQTEENSGDLAGVDIANGRIAYTTTRADHLKTLLVVLDRWGHKVMQADLGAFEQQHNPDGRTTYGVTDPSAVPAACKTELAKADVPLQYTGEKDSHPYAVAGLGDGSWLVADAGGNDLLRVDRWGHISVVAVLPAQAVKITSAIAQAQGVPDCVGGTYRFESVPTDVEVSNGRIYVSTLSGAEVDGRVYQVSWNGCLHQLVGGIPSLTNIAVTPSGKVYLAELGTGIFGLTRHGVQEVAALPGAAAVEWANGRLYASTAPVAATQGADHSPGHVVILG